MVGMGGWEQAFAIIGAVAAWTVIHAYLVVPRILKECRAEYEAHVELVLGPERKRLDAIEGRVQDIEGRCFEEQNRRRPK